MTVMLDTAALFAPDLPEPAYWEAQYPPRELPADAQVTRFAPSPTGCLHIGGMFVGHASTATSPRHSGGVYLLRIEDTDQARFDRARSTSSTGRSTTSAIGPDESGEDGRLRPVRAVAAGGDLPDVRARAAARRARLPVLRDQGGAGATSAPGSRRPGADRLLRRSGRSGGTPPRTGAGAAAAGARTSSGSARRARPGTGSASPTRSAARSADDNRNDAVILKSSDQPLRLPTYHFAHAVDDHLMRVTLVIRGEEWISSVPLHLQLFDALGFARSAYAHIAPLMKQDGGSRASCPSARTPRPASASTSSGATRPRRCSTTCAAWPTGGWPRCRCPRRWPRRSAWPSSASPGRWSTW